MNYLLGIDLGSSEISIVQSVIDANGNYEFSAEAALPSRGLTNGNVVDIEEASQSISCALDELSGSSKLRARGAAINISGLDLRGEMSRGMVRIADEPKEIGRRDLKRLFAAAETIHLPADREVIHTIPQHFTVDGGAHINNPVGLFGTRLAGDIYMVTSLASHMENLKKSIALAGLDIEAIIFSGMALGYSALSEKMRNEGAILIDAGMGVTELSIFTNGRLSFLEVLPAETNPGKFAEALKEAYAKSGMQDSNLIASGIVLGGGMSKRDDFAEALTAEFGLPLRMAPSESSVARGLVAYVAGKYRRNAHSPSWRSPLAYLRHKVTEMYYDYF